MIVLRSTYEALERDHAAVRDGLCRQVAELYQHLKESEARYSTLQQQYDTLVRQVIATIPPPKPSSVPAKPGNRIQEVIADVAGNNGALRKQLGKFARDSARGGKTEDEIVRSLMHWPSEDDE